MTTDHFATAARAEAERRHIPIDRPTAITERVAVQGFEDGAEWARVHLARQERPPFRCDPHMCGSCGGCRARGVEDKISKAWAEVERLRAQRATAWDEGFGAGWAEHAEPGAFVNDVWDAETINPYTEAP